MNYKINFDDGHMFNIDFIDNEWSYGAQNTISIERNKKINIFCNYYKDENDDRYREYMFCLDKLIKNSLIDNIFILCSDELLLKNDKIKKINFDSTFPRYRDFFNIIDSLSGENDINIIINSDCYIEKDGIKIIKNNIKKDQAYLLSRWDIINFQPFEVLHFDEVYRNNVRYKPGCSQDSWIFIGKPKKELIGDFGFGRAGCDNAIAYEFDKAGYKVHNPSLDIKIYHYHITEKRATYGDYKEREKYRIQKPYLFVPTKSIDDTLNYKKIIFFNHFHNGDIHYSREFIKDIMKKYNKAEFYYYHSIENSVWEPSDVLGDINIETIDISKIDKRCKKEIDYIIDNDTLFINTWVGQCNRKYVNSIGINLNSNYEIYKKIYDILEIDIDQNIEYYIPTIDYFKFYIGKIDEFIESNKNSFKVLISNGEVYSAQINKFSFDKIIESLSKEFPNVIFIITAPVSNYRDNILLVDDIIGKKKNLNEISYLSTFCNIIVGRSSGPYAFCQVKENFYNENMTFINFIKDEKQEWYIGTINEHIISKEFSETNVFEAIKNNINQKINKKLRIAFTIILNGIHHLKHNDYGNVMPKMFDYWIIVEGAASNKGSTRWCKNILDEYHKDGKSIDGTIDYIKDLENKHNNIIFVESNGVWNSKDDMVNRAIDEVKKITDSCFLWQVDIDEQWDKQQIIKSERELIQKGASTGEFMVYQFLGEGLVAAGNHWAGNPFIRLWDWNGEYFKSHEPPVLDNNNKNKILLSEKLKHYSFYFEQDVKFKDKWYTDHEGCYERWLKLKKETIFPIHITYLFPNFSKGRYTPGGKTRELDSWIVKYDDVKEMENQMENQTTSIQEDVKPPMIIETNKETIKEKQVIKEHTISVSILNETTNEVYCINLARRQDRMLAMNDLFNKRNIKFSRFEAVDLKENPEIGCLKSHIGVLKDALSKNSKTIAIFEDDIILCGDFEKRLEYFLETVPSTWEMLYLGLNLLNCPKTTFINRYVQKVSKAFGRFAIIVNNNRGLFERIINLSKDENGSIDSFYNAAQPEAYSFIPYLAKPSGTDSDIYPNKRSNILIYDAINKFYRDTFPLYPLQKAKPVQKTIPPSPPPQPPRKTSKEIGDEYLRNAADFQIYYGGRLIFDSSTSGRENLTFNTNDFTLYGKNFSYVGMLIKKK